MLFISCLGLAQDHTGTGNGAGEARAEFRRVATNFYKLLYSKYLFENENKIQNVTINQIRDTIKSVRLIEVDKLEVDRVGNYSPVAKNFKYPEETRYKGGLIKIHRDDFLSSNNKLVHVCHEILGLHDLDRSYEICPRLVEKLSSNISNLDLMDSFASCDIYNVKRVSIISYYDEDMKIDDLYSVYLTETIHSDHVLNNLKLFEFSQLDGIKQNNIYFYSTPPDFNAVLNISVVKESDHIYEFGISTEKIVIQPNTPIGETGTIVHTSNSNKVKLEVRDELYCLNNPKSYVNSLNTITSLSNKLNKIFSSFLTKQFNGELNCANVQHYISQLKEIQIFLVNHYDLNLENQTTLAGNYLKLIYRIMEVVDDYIYNGVKSEFQEGQPKDKLSLIEKNLFELLNIDNY